jgi:hypothetical protein
MPAYNPIYRRYINDKNIIMPNKMVRASFYLIKEYEYVDGTRGRYTEANAPIIFTLFVSRAKDIVHAVKVSDIRPDLIRRFLGKFVNEETEEIEFEGSARKLYQSIVKKVPIINENAYRTYKLSGFGRVLELDMDVNEMTPKRLNVEGISNKSQKQNK